jgi:hypothetical protein
MKLLLRIIGIAAVLIGGIWMLQGFNLLPGSFMTGDLKWAACGAGLGVVGATLLVRGWSRRPK